MQTIVVPAPNGSAAGGTNASERQHFLLSTRERCLNWALIYPGKSAGRFWSSLAVRSVLFSSSIASMPSVDRSREW
jgi:hypothetical protein